MKLRQAKASTCASPLAKSAEDDPPSDSAHVQNDGTQVGEDEDSLSDSKTLRIHNFIAAVFSFLHDSIFSHFINFVFWEYGLLFKLFGYSSRLGYSVWENIILPSQMFQQYLIPWFRTKLSPLLLQLKLSYVNYLGDAHEAYIAPIFNFFLDTFHYVTYYAVTRLEDYDGIYPFLQDLIVYVYSQIKQLSGFLSKISSVQNFCGEQCEIGIRALILFICVLIIFYLSRIILGLGLLCVIATVLPIMLGLYIIFKIFSFFAPKKKSKKGKQSKLTMSKSNIG